MKQNWAASHVSERSLELLSGIGSSSAFYDGGSVPFPCGLSPTVVIRHTWVVII